MLVTKVTLYSHKIMQTEAFYREVLGIDVAPVDQKGKIGFQVKIGKSLLEFLEVKDGSKPFYHFAINIPGKLFPAAKKWVQERTTLNLEDGEDEVYFEFLDAYSLYFQDPSGNIVEFIARNRLSDLAQSETFSIEEFISIGEINLTTTEVVKGGRQLVSAGIPVRAGAGLRTDGKLNFLGELEGESFLLLGPEGRKWFFSNRISEVHPVTIEVDQEKVIQLGKDGIVKIS